MEHELHFKDSMGNNVYAEDFIFHPFVFGRSSAAMRVCIVVSVDEKGKPRVCEIESKSSPDGSTHWEMAHPSGATRLQRPERCTLIPDPSVYFGGWLVCQWENNVGKFNQ